MNIRINALACLIGLCLSFNIFAVQTAWKTECVGRFQVSVPGEGEVAVDRLPPPYEGATRFRFSDGSIANRSSSHHLGVVSISEEVPSSVYHDRVKKNDAVIRRDVSEDLHSGSEIARLRANNSKLLKFTAPNVHAWRHQAAYDTYTIWLKMYVGNRIVFHQASSIDTASEADEAAQTFVRNFQPRPLFDLPKGEGVCIPYGFIADDGKPARQVGVTMRLIDHPDVEIFFEDQTAPRPYKTGAKLADAKHLNFFFWEEVAQGTDGIKVLFPGYRSIKLAGFAGIASFVEIKKKDGSLDYGYAAHVAGDHTAATDTPQLMLYVIRTASRAKGKPVSKNELKEMANKIAASIKRRAIVSQPSEILMP